MTGFDDAWAKIETLRDGEAVSPELRPLVEKVYSDVLSTPVDLVSLKKSLERLLEFLGTQGRTNANCWAVDLLFMLPEYWGERDWTEQNLPEEFHDVLSLMGDALHDTVQSPDVASNFGCLPEQLLERVRNLQT
ncbi:MAG: hypothetical protein WA477_23210 [Candidatus Sulfotelmatobacter sp.]